jgi:hypothetical protein
MIRKPLALTVGAMICLASVALAEIRFTGGDGSSQAKAIIIVGAIGEADGVQSEYDWTARHRPGGKVMEQQLLSDGGKVYDVLTLTRHGKVERLYFDISGYFGKY